MKAHRVMFIGPYQVELQSFEFEEAVGPGQVAIKATHSLISPGTELACLRGTESWAKHPFVPGYAGCGRVIAVGDGVDGLTEGDLVFSYAKHASHVSANRLVSLVPEGLDGAKACFARMAAVSITALRISEAELGDTVAVIGLGLVGNLCAQLFGLAGCEVIGIDLSPERCETAHRCGIPHVINAGAGEAVDEVADLTGRRMCEVVVEAIGAPAVALQAGALAGTLGEVILLGSPRGEHQADVTPFLSRTHLWGQGCITLKGAHEWRFPVRRDSSGWTKHSIERNIDILMGLIACGKLNVDPLMTHVLPPESCVAAYAGLREQPGSYMGVVFDWTAS